MSQANKGNAARRRQIRARNNKSKQAEPPPYPGGVNAQQHATPAMRQQPTPAPAPSAWTNAPTYGSPEEQQQLASWQQQVSSHSQPSSQQQWTTSSTSQPRPAEQSLSATAASYQPYYQQQQQQTAPSTSYYYPTQPPAPAPSASTYYYQPTTTTQPRPAPSSYYNATTMAQHPPSQPQPQNWSPQQPSTNVTSTTGQQPSRWGAPLQRQPPPPPGFGPQPQQAWNPSTAAAPAPPLSNATPRPTQQQQPPWNSATTAPAPSTSTATTSTSTWNAFASSSNTAAAQWNAASQQQAQYPSSQGVAQQQQQQYAVPPPPPRAPATPNASRLSSWISQPSTTAALQVVASSAPGGVSNLPPWMTTTKSVPATSTTAPTTKESTKQQSRRGWNIRDPAFTVVLKNLDPATTEPEVTALLEPVARQCGGKIVRTTFQAHKNHAFIDFDTSLPAIKAVEQHKMKPLQLHGRTLELYHLHRLMQKSVEHQGGRRVAKSKQNGESTATKDGRNKEKKSATAVKQPPMTVSTSMASNDDRATPWKPDAAVMKLVAPPPPRTAPSLDVRDLTRLSSNGKKVKQQQRPDVAMKDLTSLSSNGKKGKVGSTTTVPNNKKKSAVADDSKKKSSLQQAATKLTSLQQASQQPATALASLQQAAQKEAQQPTSKNIMQREYRKKLRDKKNAARVTGNDFVGPGTAPSQKWTQWSETERSTAAAALPPPPPPGEGDEPSSTLDDGAADDQPDEAAGNKSSSLLEARLKLRKAELAQKRALLKNKKAQLELDETVPTNAASSTQLLDDRKPAAAKRGVDPIVCGVCQGEFATLEKLRYHEKVSSCTRILWQQRALEKKHSSNVETDHQDSKPVRLLKRPTQRKNHIELLKLKLKEQLRTAAVGNEVEQRLALESRQGSITEESQQDGQQRDGPDSSSRPSREQLQKQKAEAVRKRSASHLKQLVVKQEHLLSEQQGKIESTELGYEQLDEDLERTRSKLKESDTDVSRLEDRAKILQNMLSETNQKLLAAKQKLQSSHSSLGNDGPP